MNKKNKIWLIVLFIVAGILLRLIPHAPNFTPLLAISLFSGTYLKKKWAMTVPVAAMLLSDLLIGTYQPLVMFSVYASMLAAVGIGVYLKKDKTWLKVGAGSLVAPLVFFLVTNFAVWAFTPWYAKTFTGLINCYTLAIPFFRNTLTSTVLYSATFFGAYELALKLVSEKRLQLQNK